MRIKINKEVILVYKKVWLIQDTQEPINKDPPYWIKNAKIKRISGIKSAEILGNAFLI